MEYLSPPFILSPATLLAGFVLNMQTAFPGWAAAEGALDYRIGGAVSEIGAQLNEAAADGATNIFRFFGANIANIPPVEEAFASGLTTWTATDSLGHVIPSGTVGVWLDGGGARRAFETTEAATIAATATMVSGVPVRALEPGTAANGITGSIVELASPLAYISGVTLASATNGGTEAETDAAYLTRVTEELALQSPKPITSTDFSRLLLTKTGVGRAFSKAGYNPTGTYVATGTLNSTTAVTGLPSTATIIVGTAVTGPGIPASTYVTAIVSGTAVTLNNAATESKANSLTFTGTVGNAGYVASWVGNAAGVGLSSGERAALQAEIAKQLLVGVSYNVLAPTESTINVEAKVYAWPGTTMAAMKAAIEEAITTFLNPAYWGQPPGRATQEWNNDPVVRIVNAEASILRVSGVHYVAELKLNGGTSDVTMTGVVALPKLGTLTLEVKEG